MKKRIPFVVFPLSMAKQITKPFYGWANKLLKFFPDLDVRLHQADIDIQPREYLAIAFFSFLFWSIIVIFPFSIITFFISLPDNFIFIMAGAAEAIGFLAFIYIVLYPRLVITKKVKDLEKNLLFALRHLLIQVKSGVPLFEALVSVSNGNYGLVSEELKNCTKRISTGMEQTDALEELALKNPSLDFRRILWQITSSIKSGSDLGSTLDNIVQNLAEEHKVAIRRYGSQLNPLAMMYMMLAVIIPSLGITFLIIFSSFSGFAVTETMFIVITLALAFFQFSFIGVVKSRRPAVEL